jgi:cell division protein FtsB
MLWLLVAIGYLGVITVRSITASYQSRQYIASLEGRLVALQQERARLESLLVYYQSDSFKEKELRRTLLVRRSEEKVYALPESSAGKAARAQVVTQQSAGDSRLTLPVWQQWVQYLQGK